MSFYTLIASYYRKGLYTAEQLGVFVEAGMLTPRQAAELAGHPYDGEES